MKLLTYAAKGRGWRLAAEVNTETIVDLQDAYYEQLLAKGQGRAQEIAQALLPSLPVAFFETGDLAWRAASEALDYIRMTENPSALHPYGDVQIGPPVIHPKRIICVGLNYRDHITEMKRELPDYPVIFAKFENAIIGPYDDIPLSKNRTKKLDYEGELAFVIKKPAKNVTRDCALDYVAGYMAANDISARDLQKRTLQWLQGKTLDGSLPMGPMVTSDELRDPHCLDISLTVNGEVRQKSNTRQLVFDVNFLVEFLSHIMTLDPGDVVLTGTPGGVGEARGDFLKHNDVVRVEIEGMGAIENRVVDKAQD